MLDAIKASLDRIKGGHLYRNVAGHRHAEIVCFLGNVRQCGGGHVIPYLDLIVAGAFEPPYELAPFFWIVRLNRRDRIAARCWILRVMFRVGRVGMVIVRKELIVEFMRPPAVPASGSVNGATDVRGPLNFASNRDQEKTEPRRFAGLDDPDHVEPRPTLEAVNERRRRDGLPELHELPPGR